MSSEFIRNILPVDGSINNPINSPIRFDVFVDGVAQDHIYLTVLDGATERLIVNRGSVLPGEMVTFEDVHDGLTQGLRVTYYPDDNSYDSTIAWQVDVVEVATLSCRFSYSIEPFRIPEGEFQITYDSGINISIDKLGDWMYFGSAASPLLYGSNLDMPTVPIKYGAGYAYGTSFQADAIIDEVVIFNSMRLNPTDDATDPLNRSPNAMFNNNQPIVPGRESLLLLHLDGCIRNFAPYFASKNNLFLVDGKFNEAVVIDEVPIVVPNISNFDPNEGAVELWVKRNCLNSSERHYLFDAEPFQSIFSASGTLIPDASSRLLDPNVNYLDSGIQSGDILRIESGKNIGTYIVQEIPSRNEIKIEETLIADTKFEYSIIRKFSITNNFSIYIDEDGYLTFRITDRVDISSSNLPMVRTATRTIISNPDCAPPCCDTDESEATEEFTETSGELSKSDKQRLNEYIVSTYIGDWKDTEWHHIAVSYKLDSLIADENEMRLYVDGVERGLLKVTKEAKYLNDNINRFVDRVLRRVTKDGTSYDPGDAPTEAEVEAKLLAYYNDIIAPVSTITFSEWKDSFDTSGVNLYGNEPFSNEVDRGITEQFIDFSTISYSQLFVGSDLASNNLALASLDDLRISRFKRTEQQIRTVAVSLNAAPEEIGITRLKMDFDADIEEVTDFTFLRNNISRQFEFEVEVLNDFGFPLDKTLITQLIQIIKPAHTRALVRFKD